MKCPECGRDQAYCIDSRPIQAGRRRRYRCYCCDYRFTTYEYEDGMLDKIIRAEVETETKRKVIQNIMEFLKNELPRED